MAIKKHKTILQALEMVSRNPDGVTDKDPIETPVYELVAQNLFSIANRPDQRVRGAVARALRAQKIILDRMVGLRRPGSHPAQLQSDEIDFLDLTVTPELGETRAD